MNGRKNLSEVATSPLAGTLDTVLTLTGDRDRIHSASALSCHKGYKEQTAVLCRRTKRAWAGLRLWATYSKWLSAP